VKGVGWGKCFQVVIIITIIIYVTTNRPEIIIKNKKIENMLTDRRSNTCGQECHAQGNRRDTKIQGFMYRDATNVEHEMYNYTVIRGVTRIVKRFKEKFGSYTWKTFKRFTTKDSHPRNITHNTESTAV